MKLLLTPVFNSRAYKLQVLYKNMFRVCIYLELLLVVGFFGRDNSNCKFLAIKLLHKETLTIGYTRNHVVHMSSNIAKNLDDLNLFIFLFFRKTTTATKDVLLQSTSSHLPDNNKKVIYCFLNF